MATSIPNFSGHPNGTTSVVDGLREFMLRANHLSVSSEHAKTRTSFSCQKAVPGSIDVTDKEYYHHLGGLDIIKRGYPPLEGHEWSTKQRKLLGFCVAALSHKLGHNHSYLAELWHAANPAPIFRPCVLISTITPDTKSVLERYLMRGPKFVRKLAECELDLHVIQSSITLSADSNEQPLDQDISVAGLNPSQDTVLAIVAGSRITVIDKLTGKERHCVAGGVILVGKGTYILTSRHAWASLEESSVWCRETERTQLPGHTNESVPAFSIYHDRNCSDEAMSDSDSFDSDELHSSSDESSGSNIPSQSQHTRASSYAVHATNIPGDQWTTSNSEPEFVPVNTSMIATIATQQLRSSTDDNEQSTCASQTLSVNLKVSTHSVTTDWVLASLSDHEQARNVKVSNSVDGRTVTKLHDTSTSTLDVQLALPDGVVSGKLHPSTILYTIGSHKYSLKAITLQKPLGKGNSGAWVVHENQLCGVLMAVNPDMLEAFILPINDIVKDIERVCKVSVSLPEALHTIGLGLQPEKRKAGTSDAQKVVELENLCNDNNREDAESARIRNKSPLQRSILRAENLPLLESNQDDVSCEVSASRPKDLITEGDVHEQASLHEAFRSREVTITQTTLPHGAEPLSYRSLGQHTGLRVDTENQFGTPPNAAGADTSFVSPAQSSHHSYAPESTLGHNDTQNLPELTLADVRVPSYDTIPSLFRKSSTTQLKKPSEEKPEKNDKSKNNNAIDSDTLFSHESNTVDHLLDLPDDTSECDQFDQIDQDQRHSSDYDDSPRYRKRDGYDLGFVSAAPSDRKPLTYEDDDQKAWTSDKAYQNSQSTSKEHSELSSAPPYIPTVEELERLERLVQLQSKLASIPPFHIPTELELERMERLIQLQWRLPPAPRLGESIPSGNLMTPQGSFGQHLYPTPSSSRRSTENSLAQKDPPIRQYGDTYTSGRRAHLGDAYDVASVEAFLKMQDQIARSSRGQG